MNTNKELLSTVREALIYAYDSLNFYGEHGRADEMWAAGVALDRLEAQQANQLSVEDALEAVIKWYNTPIDYKRSDEEELRAILTAKLQGK